MPPSGWENLDGLPIGAYRVRVQEEGTAGTAGQRYLAFYLEREGARSERPILRGLYAEPRPRPIPGWLDGFFRNPIPFRGNPVELGEPDLQEFFRAIGALIPPGGWLALAYETFGEPLAIHQETEQELRLGVPPILTPLGMCLFYARCAFPIRDWSIAEGWREGPRKLQGFKPREEAHYRRRLEELREEVQAFLRRTQGSARSKFLRARHRAEQLLAMWPSLEDR
ncbi:hypothetical protein HRbin22_00557 [Candidatus Thermoflexus japonica]|uniref:DUF1122 domain-containing protein n=1 Tax=Candidatus Thermoflexus japonica TaxID=2035417 RepID=A0A2H5Y4F3_9CHLR|nr:hypothetical protein HRbin22_00557 [Candidatus Thermoflexus japonica]